MLRVYKRVFKSLFDVLWSVPPRGIVGSYGRSMFNFLRDHSVFSSVAGLFSISTSNAQLFRFLHFLEQHLLFSGGILFILNNSCSSGCEMGSHCGF